MRESAGGAFVLCYGLGAVVGTTEGEGCVVDGLFDFTVTVRMPDLGVGALLAMYWVVSRTS